MQSQGGVRQTFMLRAFRAVYGRALIRSYAVALAVAPAASGATHTVVLLLAGFGRPAFQTVDFVQEQIAVRRSLLSMRPVLPVVGTCAFVAPKPGLVLNHFPLSCRRTFQS